MPRSFCFQPGPTKAEPLGLNQQQYNVAPLKDSVQLVDLPKFFDEFVWFMLDISNQFSWGAFEPTKHATNVGNR